MGASGGAAAGGAAGGIFGSLIQGLFDQRNQRFAQNFQEDMMDEQFDRLQTMFPFTNLISDQATNFYGNQMDKVWEYLEHPTPPSDLEERLYQWFGGTVPQKGLTRTGGAKKGSPEALVNRLLGRYGPGGTHPEAGRGPELLGEASDLMRSLIPYGEEWGETGFKTDIQPIQDYAQQMYDYFQAEDAERFGGNIQGSGFMDRSNRTSADLAAELGAMEAALNEAAAGRRVQGLSGPIQNLFAGPMNLETAFNTAAAQVGQNYFDRIDQARPGAALLGAMPMFANIDANQGFIQQGYPTSGTDYANVMAGLGSTAQGIGSGLGSIFDAWMSNRGDGGGGVDNSIFGDWPNQNTNSGVDLITGEGPTEIASIAGWGNYYS